jgi:ABC-type multidrug transport system ATPase subunit
MSEPVVCFTGLHKAYRRGLWQPGKQAICDIHLTLGPQQTWGLAGINGAGKSTLIRCLVGLLLPDQGSVTLCGHRPRSPLGLAQLGYLPERFAAHKHLTVTEVLHHDGELSGIQHHALPTRVAAVLEAVALQDAAHERVATLSKGMTQRLGLAQSLVHQPKVLVWDEPTTGLDPLGRRLVGNLIAQHRAGGGTMLMATHIMSDIEQHCDHIAILKKGQISLAGAIGDLKQRHGVESVEALFFKATGEIYNEP